MKNIFILGSLNMDLVIRSPYIPQNGETMFGSNFIANQGGKGANQAVAASKLGGNVKMLGAVGNDFFGTELIDNLKKYQVETTHIKHLDGVSSGIAVIIIVENDNRIILDSGANGMVTKEDVDDFLKSAKRGDYFLTQLENPIEVVGYALEEAKKKGLITILNPAPASKEIIKYLPSVDILTPNENELVLLSGQEDFEAGTNELLSLGIEKILVTLGSKGSCLKTKNSIKTYQAHKVKAIDTTAAGDTFVGSLVARMSLGSDLDSAINFASTSASLAVTRIGAQKSIPSIGEVLEVLNQKK